MNNLLISFINEIPLPNTRAGKVWRIQIENGELNINDRITITSVSVLGYSRDELYSVDATIKAIHEELDISEGIIESSKAKTNSIVAINLKNCTVLGKRINKSDITITKQSIGLSSDEKYTMYSAFFIRFENVYKALDIIREGQDILLLWFGKRITAKITYIPDSLNGMYVKLLNGRELAIPDDRWFRNMESIKRISIHIKYAGKVNYLTGILEFDAK